MNRYVSILLHSLLLIGAWLPVYFVSPSEPTLILQAEMANSSELLAFGSGIPDSRGSGGTR